MSCGCKNDGIKSNTEVKDTVYNKNVGFANKVGKIITKILAFLIMLLILPIINLFIIKFIFDILILNKNVDFKEMLSFITDKIKPTEEETDEDDEEEIEFELQDVEVLR